MESKKLSFAFFQLTKQLALSRRTAVEFPLALTADTAIGAGRIAFEALNGKPLLTPATVALGGVALCFIAAHRLIHAMVVGNSHVAVLFEVGFATDMQPDGTEAVGLEQQLVEVQMVADPEIPGLTGFLVRDVEVGSAAVLME